MTHTVQRATPADVDALAVLFARYRVFYGQAYDTQIARDFISQRIARNESVIFIARHAGLPVAFTQLYPSFSSTRAARSWILNDLYVDESARRQRIAHALLDAARQFAIADGAVRLELETDPDNHIAQALYRAMGWQPYEGTLRFRLPLPE